MMTDFLLETKGQKAFSWGANKNSLSIDVEGPTRANYISALKFADQGKFDVLIKFVRS